MTSCEYAAATRAGPRCSRDAVLRFLFFGCRSLASCTFWRLGMIVSFVRFISGNLVSTLAIGAPKLEVDIKGGSGSGRGSTLGNPTNCDVLIGGPTSVSA